MTQEEKLEAYEDRIVAFIDIQGFSEDVKKSMNDNQMFKRIKHILTTLQLLQDKESKVRMFNDAQLVLTDEERRQLADGYECTVVSDSIIMSFPATSKALEFLGIELALMQWHFLWKWKYLIRGYVSRGLCYHKNGIIFGDTYMRAYLGSEQNPNHKLPYILLEDGIVTDSGSGEVELKRRLFCADHLGRFFVNYASLIDSSPYHEGTKQSKEDQARSAKAFINNQFLQAKSSAIKEKYYWTYIYLSKISDLIKTVDEPSVPKGSV